MSSPFLLRRSLFFSSSSTLRNCNNSTLMSLTKNSNNGISFMTSTTSSSVLSSRSSCTVTIINNNDNNIYLSSSSSSSSTSSVSLIRPTPIFRTTKNITIMTSSSPELTYDVLARQDDVTSGLVLKLLTDSDKFKALSAKEGNDLIQRDKEDEDKLAKGIQISVKKGVLKSNPDVSEVQKINVLGKSADKVADEILAKLPSSEAAVLVLQGLSGTGKGTTVSKLKSRLPKCITWSNGNVFRTATYLVNQSLKEGQEFSSDVITPDLLKGIFGRLSFKQFGDTFDVVIDDTIRVSTIANTTLKEPPVSQRVPTVAEQTQGEVVLFAAQAIETLRAAGHNVILEGRAQTLNHIPTPYRFELVIPDVTILGGRRAAQRVMAAALEAVKDKKESATKDDIEKACIEAAETLK